MICLSPQHQWLNTIGPLPKLVEAALQYLGIKEIPGSASNPIILDMAKGLGLGKIYTNDDTEWCALFINHLLRICGKPPVNLKGDIYNLLRARWLANWGEGVRRGDERLGDIVVLSRNLGGHVFILLAITKAGNFVGIGGNQSNSVTIAEFSKDRVIAVRRYYATGMPPSAKQYIVGSTGRISTNEV